MPKPLCLHAPPLRPSSRLGDRGPRAPEALLGAGAGQFLVAIWRDTLAAQAIGIYDDFFDLGGHALLATRVLARIREQFHLALPLGVLFD